MIRTEKDMSQNETSNADLIELAAWAKKAPDHLFYKTPINLDAIGSYWGIDKIIRTNIPHDLGLSGFVNRDVSEHAVVVLNENESPGRQRFSCAHEYAHLILSDTEGPHQFCRQPNQSNKTLERRCDALAAEILMPREIFCDAVDHFGWTLGSVGKIASHFQVTLLAAARRILDFFTEPVLMSQWRPSKNHASVKLNYKWSFPNSHARHFKPQVWWKSSPDALAAIYEAFNDRGLIAGSSKVLVTADCETKYRLVSTEALGIGTGVMRNVVGFHYLARRA